MIQKIVNNMHLTEYFLSPMQYFTSGNLNYNNDCLACLGYPTVCHSSTRN